MGDAMRHMLTKDLFFDAPQRRAHGADLRADVDAIAVVLDHAGQAPHLALDAAQPLERRGVAVFGHDGYIPMGVMSVTAEQQHHHCAAPVAGGGVDPVCGMTVDPATAKARADYKSATYYFCCAGCRTKFIANPEKYLQPRTPEPMVEGAIYTCPMHPEIRQIGPGSCPICGMALEPEIATVETGPNPELAAMTRRFWIDLAPALPVTVLEMGGHFGAHWFAPTIANIIQFAFATPVVLWAGWPFFVRGWQSLVTRNLNMFKLIAMGTGVAYVYSVVATFAPAVFPPAFRGHSTSAVYFEAASMITVLVLMGQVLELRDSREATSGAIRALLNLTPKTARRVRVGSDIDKTGTLTEGKPTVDAIVAMPGFDEGKVLPLAANVERGSEHPLATAIVAAAQERKFELSPVRGFDARAGNGVIGVVDKRRLALGTAAFLKELNVDTAPLAAEAERLRADGATAMLLAVDGKPAGVIAIADPVKETTPDALKALAADGIRVVMLTGDNRITAQAVAKRLGIAEVEAEVLPEQKSAVIERLTREGRVVAMAGDGVNDALALAAAQVGIAMGTGTDVAIESAGITLLKGDLTGIVKARALSAAVMRNIRQNLFFAFIHNSCSVPIAAGILYPAFGILLSPIIAAAAMAMSSASVVGNALRLRQLRL